MLGDGSWGHGAPEMDVLSWLLYLPHPPSGQARSIRCWQRSFASCMNDLGYDPYWQRFMCMNWDDIGGCSAGCTDCDSCTAFRRIQPQYWRTVRRHLLRAQGKPLLCGLPHREEEAGPAALVPRERHEPKIINRPSRGAKLGVRKERFMAEIKYIPVSKLWGHPDNPRKDLGDVTELAESIKVNGVLQNPHRCSADRGNHEEVGRRKLPRYHRPPPSWRPQSWPAWRSFPASWSRCRSGSS